MREFPEWVVKQAQKNPSGFLSAAIAQPGARARSRRAATSLELWVALDLLKNHALDLQKRLAELERRNGMRYRGVWRDGNVAQEGSFYTFAGSIWHANEPTMDKPGTSKAWTLACKRGTDGKDAGK